MSEDEKRDRARSELEAHRKELEQRWKDRFETNFEAAVLQIVDGRLLRHVLDDARGY